MLLAKTWLHPMSKMKVMLNLLVCSINQVATLAMNQRDQNLYLDYALLPLEEFSGKYVERDNAEFKYFADSQKPLGEGRFGQHLNGRQFGRMLLLIIIKFE
jgi:hypothetical protein